MIARASRIALAALGTIGVVLAIVATRVVVESGRELDLGSELLRRGDEQGGEVHLAEAVRWYAPGSASPPRALARLMELATTADESGNRELALRRYRRVRGSILSVRSIFIPFQAELATADARIADLMARVPPAAADAERPFEERRARFAGELADANDADPDPFWVLVVIAGFALWVGGSFGFAAFAIDDDDHFVRGRARLWGTVVVVGLACWIAGMALA